jgi:hypothetical protein
MIDARDGKKIFVSGDRPRFRRAQQAPKADDVEKVASKLWNVRMQHYIHPGHVTSLTHYFYELRFTAYGEPGFCAFLRVRKPIIVRTP